MLDQAQHDLLNEWLSRIPENFFLQHPRLIILKGRLLQEKGFPTKANELFNQAEQIIRKSGINKKKNLTAWIETLYERGNLFMGEGHYQEALKYLKKALQVCPPAAKKFRGDILNLTGLAWDGLGDLKKSRHYLLRAKKLMDKLKVHCSLLAVECNLTLLLEKQGETKILHEMHKPLLEKLRADYCWRTGYIFINAALNALEMGKEEWTENCLNESLNLCQMYHDPRTIAGVYMGLGALNIVQENWDRARNYLEIAVNAYQKIGFSKKNLNLCFSRFYRFQQDYENVKKVLKSTADDVERGMSPMATALGVENALLEMSQGNYARTRELIKRILNLTHESGWKKEEFLALLTDAELSALEHREKEAIRKIDRALTLSKSKGYDGLMRCELRHRPKLWNLAQRIPGHKSYVASLRIEPHAPMIQVRLLGGLAILDDKGRPINVKWPSEKTRSLFTYMVIHREMPVHRELLLEQIWPDMEPQRANVNFRNTATRLRQALLNALDGQVNKDDIFTFKHKKYQLLSGVRIKVDTEEFDRIFKEASAIEEPEARSKHVIRALELYRGDFLPENYDTWTDIHRQRLKENFLNNLHWLAGYAARIGDNDGCISACEKYLAHEPFSEEISRLCMQVLVRLGRVGAVKNRYEQLKKALRQILRTAPSKETQEFYKTLIGSKAER
jgi:two-component SAPR family response regulator